MEENIKDSSLIVTQTLNKTGGFDYVLKNGTKLGDVFNFLPNGIINKKITGIGATTLELKSTRDSIIIEPLKSTVKQKTEGKSEIFPYLVENLNVSKDLKLYLNHNLDRPKKIMLVIDNLERLINDIGDSILNYFLLFDEIDFMQGSSSYRQKMEMGLDIGKSHGNFALVSATVINFSDPELEKIVKTSYSYEKEDLIPISVFHNTDIKSNYIVNRNHLLDELHSYIIYNLQNNDDKLLVALNSVSRIEKLANSLVSKGYISSSEITLLISDNKYSNRNLKERFSNKEIENDKLPTKVNFITSAYFNGYDLLDNYRLAIFTSPPVGSTMLTINEIIQIYGRNRKPGGILESIIFSHHCLDHDIQEIDFINFSIKDWLNYAEIQVDMSNCMDKHFKKKSKSINNQRAIQLFYQKFNEDLGKNKFILSRKKRIIDKKKFTESILNSDFNTHHNTKAYYQIDYLYYLYQNLKHIYLNESILNFDGEELFVPNVLGIIEALKNNMFEVNNLGGLNSWPTIKIDKVKVTSKVEIAQILDFIDSKQDIDVKLLNNKELIVFEVLSLGTKKYSKRSVIKQINALDSFDKLKRLMDYLILKNESAGEHHILIRQLSHHFKTGSKLTSIEIVDKVKILFDEIGKTLPKNLTIKKATTVLNLVFVCKPTKYRDSSGKTVSGYELSKVEMFPFLKKRKN
jgi:hypothetical protein